MNKLYNNRFIFIVSFSIIFIMVLAFGAGALTKKHATEFADSGYIISSNKVLNFNTGTTYRLNLNEQIVFTTSEGEIYEVDQSSFIHYKDGSIALLKNGAFVDLKGISESIVPYYNITNKSMIKYSDGGYTIKNGNNDLYFDDILLRVNDNKFLVAGKNLSVKVSGVDGLISGEYFELTFVENGIILIENDKNSYQVTADGTEIHVGDKTIIDLSTKNVLYDGESKLNMTQVTIDGNENITIAPDEEESTDKPNNDPSNPDNPNENENPGGEGPNGGNGEEKPKPEDNEVSVELVKLIVDVKSVTGIFQVNNPLKITGNLNISITNVQTNEVIEPTYNMTSTGYLSVFADKLNNNTTYMLTIKEVKSNGDEVEYIQRLFTTDNFGITLKKVMISDNEINYDAIFADDTDVEEVTVELYNKDGVLVEDSSKTLTKDNNNISYINLDSNSTYTMKVVAFKINSATYYSSQGYITKTVKTLKQKPTVLGVAVEPNSDNTQFNLNINGIDDPDSSITKFTYKVYKDTDLVNTVYETSTASASLRLNIGENGIVANTNYRYKAIIEYNDNEKIREIETGFSSKFISTGASVTFVQDTENTTFNTIAGEITLQDPDCTVPMPGRTECPGTNHFTVSYYVNGIKRYKDVTFEATEEADIFKIRNFSISGLSANTQYTLELNGDVIEEGNRVSQVIIGDPFTATTSDIPSLKIEKKQDNTSTFEYPINVTLSLGSNSSSNTFIDQVKTMKVKLYALDTSNNKIQIGNTVNLTNEQVKNLLYNKDYQMTNKFFGIDNLESLLSVIQDDNGWAYINYMIEFTDAYDVVLGEIQEDSNKIEIENNEVSTSISKAFLLEYYAKEKEKTNARVTEIYNRDLETRVPDLDGSTIVGYRIDGSIFVEDVLRQYYGVTGANNVINWDYIFYIYDKEGNTVYTSEKKKSTTHTFYLDDETIDNYDRGNEYSFGFQIVLSDGVYPEEAVIASREDGVTLFNPIKENPYIAMAIWKSTADSITFMYKITKDVDKALYGNNIYVYDSANNVIDTKQITMSAGYQYVTFENLSNGNTYKLMYNKVNNALDAGYSTVSKGAFIFDGLYDLTSSYTLKYTDAGNQLGIIINDQMLLARSDAFSVKVAGTNKNKEFVFTRKDLIDCGEGSTNCLSIDYKDLEEFQGLNTRVSVEVYYENGLIGLDQEGRYFVFKDDANENYLTVSDTGRVSANVRYPDGIYTFQRTDMNMSIKNHISNFAWNNDLPSANFNLTITTGGVNYSNYGSFNPKVVTNVNLTSEDDSFFFSSIIPMVDANHERKINTVKIDLNLSGVTKTIVENEFRNDDKKIYIDLYQDDSYTNPVTKSVDIDPNDLSKVLSYTFDNLLPNHTYYYKVYAHILNSQGAYVRTELYDYRADGVLEINNKTVSTLGADEIFSNVDASYRSTTSSTKYMNRNINLRTNLIDTDNYKLLYSVVDSENNIVFAEREVTDIASTVSLDYDISSNGFVFGENGYVLKITAVTLDDNANKLVLYNGPMVPHLEGDESITELREPSFKITNSRSYVPAGENKYAIDFSVAINDPDLVITNADYYVKVTDDYDNSYAPVGYTLDADGYIHLNLLNEINTLLTYKNLDPDAEYSITVKAAIYRNNASLEEKNAEVFGYDFIDTGSEYNLKLGRGTLEVNNNVLSINYQNASNLNNITRISATVRKDNALVGTYEISGSKLNFVNADDAWRLNLDLTNIATSLESNDRVRIIIRYYANNLAGEEGLVDTVTYANYSLE